MIKLSEKFSLPLPKCSKKLEDWIVTLPDRAKITREYLVEGLDANGNGYVRMVSEENYDKLDKKNTVSFLFSVEKERPGGVPSTYQPSNSTFTKIRRTSQLRSISVAPVEPEPVKEVKKEIPVKKPMPSGSKDTVVSKFFSEKPKEVPKKEEPQKVDKILEVKKEIKSEAVSDTKISPPKAQVPPKAHDKKTDGKFKGKAAPVGNKMITSFFTKVSKPAAPPPAPVAAPAPVTVQPKEEIVEEKPKIVPEVKKRPLSDEKSPASQKPQKKMKMSKKPKVKAGKSRILQIVDEDSSDSDGERIEEISDEDTKEKNVQLENEDVKVKTPPRPIKHKKKKTIRECFKDEDGYDSKLMNFS